MELLGVKDRVNTHRAPRMVKVDRVEQVEQEVGTWWWIRSIQHTIRTINRGYNRGHHCLEWGHHVVCSHLLAGRQMTPYRHEMGPGVGQIAIIGPRMVKRGKLE